MKNRRHNYYRRNWRIQLWQIWLDYWSRRQ